MFVEKKLNKSGSTSVRIMQKVHDGKKMSVMLRTDYDEEVMLLLDAIGLKP